MRYRFKVTPVTSKGFTLIELMVVLFIIGLGSAIVSLSIGRAYEKALLTAEARRMQNTMRAARELALMGRTPVTFALDKEKRQYWLEKDGQPYVTPGHGATGHGIKKTLPEGFTLKGEPVVFLAKGDSTGGALSIIDRQGRQYVIVIDPVTGAPQPQKSLRAKPQ